MVIYNSKLFFSVSLSLVESFPGISNPRELLTRLQLFPSYTQKKKQKIETKLYPQRAKILFDVKRLEPRERETERKGRPHFYTTTSIHPDHLFNGTVCFYFYGFPFFPPAHFHFLSWLLNSSTVSVPGHQFL